MNLLQDIINQDHHSRYHKMIIIAQDLNKEENKKTNLGDITIEDNHLVRIKMININIEKNISLLQENKKNIFIKRDQIMDDHHQDYLLEINNLR